MGTPVRYRLDPGERFAIVGTSRVGWSLSERESGPRTLAEVDVRFVIDCDVVEDHGDETVTIDCRLRELGSDVRSPLGGLAVPGGVGPFRAAPWLRPWARSLAGARGQPLTVRKSLYGDLVTVTTTDAVRAAMAGITPEAVLQWYGALFPRSGRPAELHEHLEVKPARFGMPVPGRVPVELDVRYRRLPAEPFAGRSLPTFGVEMRLRVPERRWGPFVLEGSGEGDGRVLADVERGKIARSVRHARVSLSLRARQRALARFDLTIASDAWHEDHPPDDVDGRMLGG